MSVVKTIDGTIDEALFAWSDAVSGRSDFSHVGVARAPETTRTKKWCYWRCGLADGSRVVVNISAESPSKAILSIQHEGLESAEQAEHRRRYWKELLDEL
jgi:hypothetical protein